MLRFSLRTLLILVTVFGCGFARIAYLKHKADFHRREASVRIARITNGTNNRYEQIARTVRKDNLNQTISWRLIRDNRRDGSWADCWASAYFHEIMADRYDRAVYRPWKTVSESELP